MRNTKLAFGVGLGASREKTNWYKKEIDFVFCKVFHMKWTDEAHLKKTKLAFGVGLGANQEEINRYQKDNLRFA